MILYPEGTRSRDGSVGTGRPGAGVVALTTGARVLPVAIDGMGQVLPIGRTIPRIGKRIHVVFRPPVELPAMPTEAPGREEAQALVDHAMAGIREQLAAIRQEEAARRSTRTA